MRLWHYKLLEYLPPTQLKQQWRDCVNLSQQLQNSEDIETINRYINTYPVEDFITYCYYVASAMLKQGHIITDARIQKLNKYIKFDLNGQKINKGCFEKHHDGNYATICYYLLYEYYRANQPDFTETMMQNIGKICSKLWETEAWCQDPSDFVEV